MDVSYVDLVILIPLIYGGYQGYKKGLVISIATMAGLALGIWGGFKFSHYTSELLYENWELDVPLLSFAVTFIVILILVYLLGKMVEKMIDTLSLGIFNKVGGLLAGAIRVGLILVAASLFFDSMNKKFELVPQEQFTSSLLYPKLQEGAQILMPVFDDLKEKGAEFQKDSTLALP